MGRNVTFNEELNSNNKTFIQRKQPAKLNDIKASRLIKPDTSVSLKQDKKNMEEISVSKRRPPV